MAAPGEDRRTQFLRGSLDMCVLALLRDQPSHVYALTDRFSAAGIDNLTYGTLYPLVTRLRRSGLVVEHLESSTVGPARKVFSPSAHGEAMLRTWAAEWFSRTEVVRGLLTGCGLHPTPTKGMS